MKKYYLFGAGANGYSVIHFLGKQNIVAVIDNNVRKQGTEIADIPIISLQDYIDKNDQKMIVITGFYDSTAIIDSLKEKGITNYYESPYIQNGFFKDGQDIVDKLELNKYREIIFGSMNPISEWIVKILSDLDERRKFYYMDRDDSREMPKDAPVVITNVTERRNLERQELAANFHLRLDINTIYEKKYAYKNPELADFKDKHKGQRCFLIGNGPSLRYEDLKKLHEENEICFGCNRIYLAYTDTDWRPDYYVAVDHVIVRKDSAKILELDGIKFVRHSYCQVEEWSKNGVYEFRGLTHPYQVPQISFDILEGVYMGNTVIYDALQIALYMGFQEIYLLGVDMTTGIKYEDEGSHFYKSPDTKENLGTCNTLEARRSLGYAAKEMKKRGRKLWNATRGGELEEVPRIDFDSLF